MKVVPMYSDSNEPSREVRSTELDLAILDFVRSTSRVLLVEGSDVSCMGKLVMHVQTVAKRVLPDDSITVLAPYTRIANAYSSGATVFSIYGAIYEPVATDRPDENLIVNQLRQNRDDSSHLYIVGDCHLISDVYQARDQHRFGSGRLLKDFMEYVDRSYSARKIIFVGDPWQLRGARKLDTAVSISKLREYSEGVTKYVAKGFASKTVPSILLRNRQFLASRISTQRSNLLKLEMDESDCLRFPTAAGRIQQLVRKLVDEGVAETKLIAHTNARVNWYTRFIRREVLGRRSDLEHGDLVVARNTFSMIGSGRQITSGTFGEVCAVLGEKRIVQGLRGRSKPVSIDLLRVRIQWHDKSDCEGEQVLCFKEYLYAEKPELSRDVCNALIARTKSKREASDSSRSEVCRNTTEFSTRNGSSDLEDDPHLLNAAKLRFGYAMTLHYAQGMHFDRVVADLAPGKGIGSGEGYLRWLYTLFTVVRRNTYLINIPYIHPFGLTQWACGASRHGPVRPTIPTAFDPEAAPSGRPAEFNIESKELRNLFRFVRDRLAGIGCRVTEPAHKQYQEVYHVVSDSGASCTLRLYFNKTFHVTRVNAATSQPGDFAEQITKTLAPEPVFEDERQEELYYEMADLIAARGMTITAVEHHQYQEVYLLQGETGKAKIGVYYDKDGTATQGRLQEHSSDAILHALKELFAS